MTTDPRKLAQEARKNEGNAYNDRGYSKSTDAILQKRREKIIELAAALDTALDEQDTLREKISSHESADYEWQKNAALFWREKDRISEAEIARLQAENERLVRALNEVREVAVMRNDVSTITFVDQTLENHGKQ